ncbi:hypothetical protein LCGC14_1702170 [marine sediment metagenome]|uniref:Uncharacterized protein n=1 Tax=marine sediment metagenome TaxID=412755 RepID=A0A0F9I576_9ZZZZ
MAIRLRKINSEMIALCAVESDPKRDDIYLDDEIHYALATKFMEDYGLGGDKKLVELMNKEKVRDAKKELINWRKLL